MDAGASSRRAGHIALAVLTIAFGLLGALMVTGGLLNIDGTADATRSTTGQDLVGVVAFSAGFFVLALFTERGLRIARRKLGLRVPRSTRSRQLPSQPALARRWAQQKGHFWLWMMVASFFAALSTFPKLVAAQGSHPINWLQIGLGIAGATAEVGLLLLFITGRAIDQVAVGNGWLAVRKIWWRRWYVIYRETLSPVRPAFFGGVLLADQWGRHVRLPRIWLTRGVGDALLNLLEGEGSQPTDKAGNLLRAFSRLGAAHDPLGVHD